MSLFSKPWQLRHFRNLKLAFVLSLVLTLSSCVQGYVSPADNPSIMIVGDSISQGRNGDFTWRYRLWDWFYSNGVSVTFVGPYTGTAPQGVTQPPIPPEPYGPATPGTDSVGFVAQSGGYSPDIPSTSAFYGSNGGQNHFAVWGRQLAQDVGLIGQIVQKYEPDYLLVELGFNDVGWFISDASQTLQNMITFIGNARASNPNIAFAIANIPQRTFIGGRDDLIEKTDEYNTALPALLESLSTAESPIQLVQFQQNYDCYPNTCPAGSDGLHPAPLGEFQIAKAFADTLSQGYCWPGAAFTIPSDIPVRACATPSNLVVQSSTCGITATWDVVDGAYGYNVYNGPTGFGMSSFFVSAPSLTSTWVAKNFSYTFQVEAVCSNVVSGMSAEVSGIADPTCAPGPSNIRTTSTADGVDFTWDTVEGYDIFEYGVIYWDMTTQPYLTDYGWNGTSASYGGMNAGDRLLTAVETWATVDGVLCAGIPAGGQGVVVGGGKPGTPSNVAVNTIDNGATAVVTWDADPNAFGYQVWTRYLSEPNPPLVAAPAGSSTNCATMGEMFPGVWHYEFCVTAMNGNYSSALSQCVTGPQNVTDVPYCGDPPPTLSPTSVTTAVASPTVSWSTSGPTSISETCDGSGGGPPGGGPPGGGPPGGGPPGGGPPGGGPPGGGPPGGGPPGGGPPPGNSGASSGTASECTVQTASECTSACVDSSCTTSCTTVVECDATGTTTGMVYTAAPWYIDVAEMWSMETAAPSDVSAEALSQASEFISLYGTAYPNWPSSYITSGAASTVSATPTSTTPTSSAPAEATCYVAGQVGEEDAGIWTNYVTDNGTALEAAINQACAGQDFSGWTAYEDSSQWTDSDGVTWTSSNLFRFSLEVTHPQVIECINRGITAAGGDPKNPTCTFHAVLDPPS